MNNYKVRYETKENLNVFVHIFAENFFDCLKLYEKFYQKDNKLVSINLYGIKGK
ncbi:MAG: hypothetical protein ACTSQG_00125 [Promethearchaeota archaeon]